MKKLFIATSLLLVAAITTQAQTAATPSLSGEDSVQVKYLGAQDDLILFNVAFRNPAGKVISLFIKDQDGNELYKNSYSEKTFSKQFRLPRADRSRILFIVRYNKDNEIVKTFEVNVNSRYIEDIAVKKLN